MTRVVRAVSSSFTAQAPSAQSLASFNGVARFVQRRSGDAAGDAAAAASFALVLSIHAYSVELPNP